MAAGRRRVQHEEEEGEDGAEAEEEGRTIVKGFGCLDDDTAAASQTSAATSSRSRGSRMCAVCCVGWKSRGGVLYAGVMTGEERGTGRRSKQAQSCHRTAPGTFPDVQASCVMQGGGE